MADMRVSAGQGSAEDLQGPFVPLLESLEQGWYCAGGGVPFCPFCYEAQGEKATPGSDSREGGAGRHPFHPY